MKLTVVSVVFNAVNAIEKTICSVIGQPIGIEYIVIDGGSTDGTVEIIEKYKDKISYFVSEKDDGIADAFNKGLAVASGEIIGILNAGDTYAQGTLKSILEFDGEWDILYGDVRFLEKGYDFIFKPNHKRMSRFMGLAHPGVFVKKEIYKRLGLFSQDYKYAMDYELLLRFYESGAKFCYLDKLLADMQMGGASDVHWIAAYWEAFLIKSKYYGLIYPFLFFLSSFSKRIFRNLLVILGLRFIVSSYRKTLSPIKKF